MTITELISKVSNSKGSSRFFSSENLNFYGSTRDKIFLEDGIFIQQDYDNNHVECYGVRAWERKGFLESDGYHWVRHYFNKDTFERVGSVEYLECEG